MVGPWSHLWDFAGRSAFEFPVLDNGEIDLTHYQVGVVDSNPLLNGCGIKGVGQVGSLTAFHHLHILMVVGVTTVSSSPDGGYLTVFSPKVAVADVVVVRYGDAGPVAEGFPEL